MSGRKPEQPRGTIKAQKATPREKRPVGRPRAKAVEGERINYTFRIRLDLRRQLTEAAEKAGRSLSEEIEFRLERSLEQDYLDRLGTAVDEVERVARIFEAYGESILRSVQSDADDDGEIKGPPRRKVRGSRR